MVTLPLCDLSGLLFFLYIKRSNYSFISFYPGVVLQSNKSDLGECEYRTFVEPQDLLWRLLVMKCGEGGALGFVLQKNETENTKSGCQVCGEPPISTF